VVQLITVMHPASITGNRGMVEKQTVRARADKGGGQVGWLLGGGRVKNSKGQGCREGGGRRKVAGGIPKVDDPTSRTRPLIGWRQRTF